MIIIEKFTVGETEFNRVYSDENRYVVRDGVSYEEACDPAEYGREYTEGDPIPETFTDDTGILKIMLGEENDQH